MYMCMLTSCPGTNMNARALTVLLIDKAAGKLEPVASEVYSSHLHQSVHHLEVQQH